MTLNAMTIPAMGGLSPLPPLSSLGTLVLDLNANDFSSLTFRGETDFVEGWADASASSNDATQTTEAKQPEYYSSLSQLGGAPGLLSSGASATTMHLATIAELANDWTVLAAYAHSLAGSGWQELFDSQTGRLIIAPSTDTSVIGYYDTAIRASTYAATTDANQVTWELVATNSARVRVNGVDETTGMTYAQRALGGDTQILSGYTETFHFQGWLNRLAIFEGSLSAADLLTAERVMAAPIGVSF